jgi:hypothetical protein
MTPDDGRPIPGLYDSDFYAWTQQQARLLKAGRLSDVDMAHVIEEIEDLGKSDLRTCASFIALIIEHFLKLEYFDRPEDFRHHRHEIGSFRVDLDAVLTNTLRRELQDDVQTSYRRAVRRLKLHDYTVAGLPKNCPYSWEQIIDDDWFPPPRAQT